jgi:phosphonopyruvate decarboxylase
MISAKDFFDALTEQGVTNFSGVPDSLLKDICAYISDNTSSTQHVITANEGAAIALAAGQYLTSGKPSLVYMQNSGFGNAINPLLSLVDQKVYSIPMLVMIGWRGEPGVKDEPQHLKQGEIMIDLLDACGLPTVVIDAKTPNINEELELAMKQSINGSQPVVLLIRKGTFKTYKLKNIALDISQETREEAINKVIEASEENDLFISTTGMASRELFEIRVKNNQPHDRDFLTVGSMGHASMIALGIAQNTDKHVFCIDGDGACLMHLGNLTSIGQSGAINLIHILLNNSAHDSVGGQPTVAGQVDLTLIAKACGYASVGSISEIEKIGSYIMQLKHHPGPHLLEVKIKKGSRAALGRPTSTPRENKEALMKFLK